GVERLGGGDDVAGAQRPRAVGPGPELDRDLLGRDLDARRHQGQGDGAQGGKLHESHTTAHHNLLCRLSPIGPASAPIRVLDQDFDSYGSAREGGRARSAPAPVPVTMIRARRGPEARTSGAGAVHRHVARLAPERRRALLKGAAWDSTAAPPPG